MTIKPKKSSKSVCANCGDKFRPKVDWQRCCSHECADALRHRRAYQRRNGNVQQT